MDSAGLHIAVAGYPERVGNYLAALEGCGAKASVIGQEDDAEAYSGLLLPGGVDVAPAYYGQKNTACGAIDDALDAMQMKVTEDFLRAGKPILGICRGHQLLNVFFGGTLIQHILQHERHAIPSGSHEDKLHECFCDGPCFLHDLYGERFVTNSSHHQAVDRPGAGFRICAASDDGVCEAIVHQDLPVVGVQFHPERMTFAHRRSDTVDGRLVFDYFLSLCAEREASSSRMKGGAAEGRGPADYLLFLRQKRLLDTFLSHGAIEAPQYEKSLHDLSIKMGIPV